LEIAWSVFTADGAGSNSVESSVIRQPDDTVPARIRSITGITDDDLQQAIELTDSLPALEAALTIADNRVVIHFAQFERGFLAAELPEFFSKMQIYCTHQIAARLFPNLPSRGIRGLAGYFGICLDECKRASSHVQATGMIWTGLVSKLSEIGIETFDQLDEWLKTTQPSKRTHYEYPLNKELRLSLPDAPGIYRMLSRAGDILYVGKATSLKSRVNSYFRGRRGRDSRKLEMLTQAWDIQCTVCDTVVEACVMEVDEIKRLRPPYNISLKDSSRPLVFYDWDFAAVVDPRVASSYVGPFRNEWVMDPFVRLVASIRTGVSDPLMFFDVLSEELLRAGLAALVQRHSIETLAQAGPRFLLAAGLRLLRLHAEMQDDDDENSNEEDRDDTGELVELTPEQVADKYERLLMRAARAYLLSKRLTRLLNAKIEFTESGKTHTVYTHNGRVGRHQFRGDICHWVNLDTTTFDRVRVLHTELMRIKRDGGHVTVQPYGNAPDAEHPERIRFY
jgi:DNA polymerase-3 subunit epsilon